MQCQKWMLLDVCHPLNKPSCGANAHVVDRLMRAREYIGSIGALFEDYFSSGSFCKTTC